MTLSVFIIKALLYVLGLPLIAYAAAHTGILLGKVAEEIRARF